VTESEKFLKCTTKTIRKDGHTTVSCKKGLWSVEAYHEINAVTEAMHYFRQYASDGEYSDIIGGKTAFEVLSECRA